MVMAMVMPEYSEVKMIELTPRFMPYRIRLDDMGRERCVNPVQFSMDRHAKPHIVGGTASDSNQTAQLTLAIDLA